MANLGVMTIRAQQMKIFLKDRDMLSHVKVLRDLLRSIGNDSCLHIFHGKRPTSRMNELRSFSYYSDLIIYSS
jgi:hypothetical protein